MLDYQKKYLRAIASKDKHVLYHFPRATGKTYVRNLVSKIGKLATHPTTNNNKGR